jgi:glycosyltransferase involved in cell wall biosynthesis
LLPNAVDVDRFEPDARAAERRAALGWPEARLTVVYVGTVGLAQGLSTAVAAMERLGDAGIMLHVVGGGADRGAIEARIRTSGQSNVILHEPVAAASVPAILAAGDAVLVMLRAGGLYDESLPTKLVEGLAAGRPIVVSAGGEAARIVRAAGAGSVAVPEDAGALAAALEATRDEPDRAAVGRRARATAEADFDRDVVVARLHAILQAAADGRRADKSPTGAASRQ